MEAVAKTPEREAFYKKIDGENLSALWNVLGDLITPEPKSACRAASCGNSMRSATT